MVKDYQKINTLFKRDERNRIILSEYTCEEFKYLENVQWECTEKIDGTNIHIDIIFKGNNIQNITFAGRTKSADIPIKLKDKLTILFTKETIGKAFNNFKENEEVIVSIYGEGYGLNIQKGGNYISNDVSFILFDVKVGNWWLNRESCEDIAKKLNIDIVPLIGYMTIPEAIYYVSLGFKSMIAENKEYNAEGLVLKTPFGLQFRNGERIITKLKTKDFKDLLK